MKLKGPGAYLVLISLIAACAPAMRPSIEGTPSASLMAQLWNAPARGNHRDLVDGPGGARHAPDPHALYQLVKEEHGGFSWKMEVKDPSGTKWNVKLGPEAQPEVTSSRIVWSMGYHQPPNYYLPVWTLVDKNGQRRDMPSARFLAKRNGLEKEGHWSWHHNPFVDTEPFRGLIVLMMVLNSTDLKDDNNALYDLPETLEHARRWYVVKDLGATLGETGRVEPVRGNPEVFEKQPFVRGLSGSRVLFAFNGRHQELLSVVHVDDVHWMCNRLARLSPEAWRDVFRAGGYDDAQTARFVRKIQEKIVQGQALKAGSDR